jgi:hypothetical protein
MPGAGAVLHCAAVTALPDSETVRPMIAPDRPMTRGAPRAEEQPQQAGAVLRRSGPLQPPSRP